MKLIRLTYISLLPVLFCTNAHATDPIKRSLLDEATQLNPQVKIKKVAYFQGTTREINKRLDKVRDDFIKKVTEAQKNHWVRILYYDGKKTHQSNGGFSPISYMLMPSQDATIRGLLFYAVPKPTN